jgi:hypothetical protein
MTVGNLSSLFTSKFINEISVEGVKSIISKIGFCMEF